MIEQLRQALFTRLTSGTPLGAIAVYDYVPEGSEKTPPFVALGDTETQDADTDTSDGATAITELHVYSKYKGSKQLGALLDDVRALFHHYALTVSGATVILVTADSVQSGRGPDGTTREGVVRVRVLLDDITP